MAIEKWEWLVGEWVWIVAPFVLFSVCFVCFSLFFIVFCLFVLVCWFRLYLFTDDSLHEVALAEQLPAHLVERLKVIVAHLEEVKGAGGGGADDEGPPQWSGGPVVLLEACVSCLLVLATLNTDVQATLRQNQGFLLTALRGGGGGGGGKRREREGWGGEKEGESGHE